MSEFVRDIVDLDEAAATIQRVSKRLAHIPDAAPTRDPLRIDGYVLPVRPPSSDWYIAQGHKWSPGNLGGHTGLDINTVTGGDTDLGESVYSTCNGVVVYAQQAPGAYWGNIMIVMARDANNLIFWRYAHLNEIRTYTGAYVLAGDEIGTIGKGGRNRYWAHLHLDAWRGEMQAPAGYRTRYVRWVDPLVVWATAGYKFKWGVRK